jgi:hypothetical protein
VQIVTTVMDVGKLLLLLLDEWLDHRWAWWRAEMAVSTPSTMLWSRKRSAVLSWSLRTRPTCNVWHKGAGSAAMGPPAPGQWFRGAINRSYKYTYRYVSQPVVRSG